MSSHSIPWGVRLPEVDADWTDADLRHEAARRAAGMMGDSGDEAIYESMVEYITAQLMAARDGASPTERPDNG